MDVALQRLRLGRDGRSQMLTGLRGVGKTVMLNEFEQLAEGRGYFHEHVEVGEDGDLAPRLASAFRRVCCRWTPSAASASGSAEHWACSDVHSNTVLACFESSGTKASPSSAEDEV